MKDMKKPAIAIVCALLLMLVSLVSIYAAAESQPSLTLSETAITVFMGKTARVVPTIENGKNSKKAKYTWESSDESVAAVNNGNVKAVNEGKAVITCKTILEDGSELTASVDVTVAIPVASLKLTSDKQLTVTPENPSTITVEVMPPNATDQSLLWTSSDETVASVDHNGTVKALSAGKATIIGQTADGSKKKVQVSVYVPSLFADTDSVIVDSMDGNDFTFHYYGSNWDSDVVITQKGEAFRYSASRIDDQVTVHFDPLCAVNGTLTIKDRKDAKSKLTLNVSVTNEAIPYQRYIEVTNFKFRKGSMDLAFRNNSGREIAWVEFTLIPYNASKEIIQYSNAPGWESNFHAYPSKLLPGKTFSNRGEGSYKNAEIDDIDISVHQIEFSDETMLTFSDSGRYWYSLKEKAYHGDLNKAYTPNNPDELETEKAASFTLGYRSEYIYQWDCALYGYHNGGFRVIEIVPGSIAEKAGLQVDDLVISVDGINKVDDEFCTIRGKAKIADGEKVVFTVERPGVDGTVDLIMSK